MSHVTDSLVPLVARRRRRPRAGRRRPPRALRGRLDAALPRPGARRGATGRHRAGRRGAGAPAARTAPPSCPRAATRGWSARACRAAARSSSAPRASRDARRGRPRGRAGRGRRGRHLAATPGPRAAAGLDAGVDLGARDSATVGGLVATNAGGTHALRHGTVRARVAALQAVLADGTIVDRPDPAQGQCRLRPLGAAGRQRGHARRHHRRALAPRTAVHEPRRRARRTRLARAGRRAADRRAPAPALAARRRLLPRRGPAARARPPATSPRPCARARRCTSCWSARRSATPTDELAQALGEAGIDDALVADRQRRARRGCGAFARATRRRISAVGIPHKLDVGVPLARLAEFAARVPRRCGASRPARGW